MNKTEEVQSHEAELPTTLVHLPAQISMGERNNPLILLNPLLFHSLI